VDYLKEVKMLKANYHSERSFKSDTMKKAEGTPLFDNLTVLLAKWFIHSLKTHTSAPACRVK
jgi:hypothetical protein